MKTDLKHINVSKSTTMKQKENNKHRYKQNREVSLAHIPQEEKCQFLDETESYKSHCTCNGVLILDMGGWICVFMCELSSMCVYIF